MKKEINKDLQIQVENSIRKYERAQEGKKSMEFSLAVSAYNAAGRILSSAMNAKDKENIDWAKKEVEKARKIMEKIRI